MTAAGVAIKQIFVTEAFSAAEEKAGSSRVSGSFDGFAYGNAPIEEPAFHWVASYAERRPEKLACRIVPAAD